MKNKALYKYINLLLRITIGIAAVYFIYLKLKDNFLIGLQQVKTESVNLLLIVLVLLIMILNWGIEAIKWRYSIKKTKEITVFKAFKLTITGITLSILTPNRIGEIPFRAFLLSRDEFKELTLKTIVGSYSQVLITLMMGVIGLLLNINNYSLYIDSFILVPIVLIPPLILIMIYFKVNRLEKILNKIRFFKEKKIFTALSEFSMSELFKILLMSFMRYTIFSLQYYLILRAFGVMLNSFNDMMLICVCFMFTSFIPTILLSEIGIRGSIALFVFGVISTLHVQIVIASVLLWVINVAIPAIFGLFNLNQIKIYKTV